MLKDEKNLNIKNKKGDWSCSQQEGLYVHPSSTPLFLWDSQKLSFTILSWSDCPNQTTRIREFSSSSTREEMNEFDFGFYLNNENSGKY